MARYGIAELFKDVNPKDWESRPTKTPPISIDRENFDTLFGLDGNGGLLRRHEQGWTRHESNWPIPVEGPDGQSYDLYMMYDETSGSFTPNLFVKVERKAPSSAPIPSAPEAAAAPEATRERTPIPPVLAALIEEVAAAKPLNAKEPSNIEVRRQRLLDFWEVYKQKAEMDSETGNRRARGNMQIADSDSDPKKPNRDKAIEALHVALEVEGEVIWPAQAPASVPPVSRGGGGAPSGVAEEAPDSDQTPDQAGGATGEPDSTTSRTSTEESNNVPAQSQSPELTPGNVQKLINEFLSRKGYGNSREAAVLAIMGVLSRRAWTPQGIKDLETFEQDMKDMEAFLKTGTFEDEIDREVRDKDLPTLESEEAELKLKIKPLDMQIDGIESQLKRAKSLTPDDRKKMGEEATALSKERLPLAREMRVLKEAIKRKMAKKTRETVHQQTPEQLLGMINLHFAKQDLIKDKKPEETPNYTLVLAETQAQLEAARDRELGERKGAWGWLADLVEPRLTSTLRTVVEKDRALKQITTEQINKLIDSSDNRGGVEAWINDLEDAEGKDIPEKEKMEKIVPTLIGHLAYAVGTNRLNTYSRENGKKLLSHLRHAVHTYSMKEAKKSSGESTDKMDAYFDRLNDLNGSALKVKHDIVKAFSRRCVAGNIGLPVAAGALAATTILTGGATLAGMGAIGATMASGAAVGGSFKVQSPEAKAWLRRNAVRGLAAGGIGALALGVTPWIAAPLAVGGFFAPNLWKNKAAIGAGGVAVGAGAATVGAGAAKLGWKGTKAVAPVAGRLGLWGVPRVAIIATFFGLLPLAISERYRSWFFSLPKLRASHA